MAQEGGCKSRVVRGVERGALALRRPARALAGSVQTAVVKAAVVVGAYELIMASVYSEDDSRYQLGMRGVIVTASRLAFLSVLANGAIIFGVLRRKKEMLHTTVCATLVLYLFNIPMSFGVAAGITLNGRWPHQLWEVPRILLYPTYVGLLYCLLSELRGEVEEPTEAAAAAGDGWLKNNLAQHGPSGLAADAVAIKMPLDCPNLPAAPPNVPRPAPVHFASGPLSSSEA